MKIINISNSLYDVFSFDGWENWSRWSKDKRGFYTQVGGEPVTGFLKSLIIKQLLGAK